VTAWLDRLTLSQRKLVFAGVAVGLIGLGAFAFRLSLENQRAPDAATTPVAAPSSRGRIERLPGMRDDAVPVEGQGAKGAALAVSDEEIAAAQAVAERFAVEYATRRWNEPLNARVARMAPLMSDELAAAFSADSGSAALEDERRALREVTTAKPEFAYPQTVSRDELIFTVVVVQTLSTTRGTQEQRPSFQVVLAPRAGGWRVVNVVA
jgi:fructose-specific phosphotransferase system component IIB